MQWRHIKGPALLLTFQCKKIIPFNSCDTVYYYYFVVTLSLSRTVFLWLVFWHQRPLWNFKWFLRMRGRKVREAWKNAISQKRDEIEPLLLLKVNGKSYMLYRMVSFSMTWTIVTMALSCLATVISVQKRIFPRLPHLTTTCAETTWNFPTGFGVKKLLS